MAQFDVYERGEMYLLDCQADILDNLATRSVAPLFPVDLSVEPTRRLNPVFTIENQPFIFMPQLVAAVPVKQLGRPVASLLAERDAVIAAFDMLFTGY